MPEDISPSQEEPEKRLSFDIPESLHNLSLIHI